VIGATFIAFGVVSHVALRFDPLPDRLSMGQFAGLESLIYAIGFLLLLSSLMSASMSGVRRALLSLLWLAGALAALVAVIDSFPS
jgi:hypothetical protein